MAKVRLLEIADQLDLGGTEYTLQMICQNLSKDRFEITIVALNRGGIREKILLNSGFSVYVLNHDYSKLDELIQDKDIVHIHGSGSCNTELFSLIKKNKPKLVVQTNVFGLYDRHPFYDLVDIDLFVSKMILVRRMSLDKSELGRFLFKRRVLYNPVDYSTLNRIYSEISEKDALLRKFNIVTTGPVIGRIGRADDSKFDLIAFDGFKHLLKYEPKAKFLLVGDTPKMVTYAKKIGIEDSMIVLPNTSDINLLISYYKCIDIFLAASRMGESFGMVISEAMALGIPVVTISMPTRDNAQIELVDNMETGIVVKRSAKHVGLALKYLFQNEELRKKFGENSQKRVRDNFDVIKIISQIEHLFLNYPKIDDSILLPWSRKMKAEYISRLQKVFGQYSLLDYFLINCYNRLKSYLHG